MPTNPGTVDEKPVLLDVVGDKAGTDGTMGMREPELMEIWEPFLRVYWLLSWLISFLLLIVSV
jgi:hypothetical protein